MSEVMIEPKIFEVDKIRADFPILQTKVNGNPLIYFDNAASSQKPRQVIDSIVDCYQNNYANIHRAIHRLAENATQLFEETRRTVQKFINSASQQEIIFTKGTTEGINLIATCLERAKLIGPDDQILISQLEHHANIVPWQILCQNTGAKLLVIPIDAAGNLDQEAFTNLLSPKVKFLAITQASNAIGTLNPLVEMIRQAKKYDIPVLVDGAQAIAHLPVDVQELACDFYVFSAHKMLGPSGVGVLYGKRTWLERLPPYQVGGEMVKHVSFAATEYNEIPYKFEAGTPNIADVIGFKVAIEYLQNLGHAKIMAHEQELLKYAQERILSIPGVLSLAAPRQQLSLLSLKFTWAHAQDVGILLDQFGIAVRTGHHCAIPLMESLGCTASLRVSMAFYNTFQEIEILVQMLNKIRRMML